MNQESRKPQERDADNKSNSSPPKVSAADTRESEKDAPKSAKQSEPAANFHQITRWDRFKKWVSEVTVAEVGMFLLTFVIAGSTIVYTVFAHRQWKVMSGQLSETQRARQDDLRPYVTVTHFDIVGEVGKGKPFKGVAQIVNSGKTPAIKANDCSDVTILSAATPMTDDFPCPSPYNPQSNPSFSEASNFTIGSGAPFTVESRTIQIKTIHADHKTVELIPALVAGWFRLYIYGELAYGDILDPKAVHHTRWCGIYNPVTKSLYICEKHNGMD